VIVMENKKSESMHGGTATQEPAHQGSHAGGTHAQGAQGSHGAQGAQGNQGSARQSAGQHGAMSHMQGSSRQDWPGSMQHPGHGDHSEGMVARAIEQQTARLPSDLFLWAACGSIMGSLVLQATGRQHASLFVGQWAPTFLILGLYNKLVKVAGSD